MRYFKTKNDEIYAYDDNIDEKYIKAGLISITKEQADQLLNPPLTPEQLAALAEDKKIQLRSEADGEIAWRQDAVDSGSPEGTEANDLAKWKEYRISLMRLDISTGKSIEWPLKPE
ncbi:tail fiber assembly protein [Yersinia ruckeri]|uniref:tail fiber assembly protein n=1 Tax=Yersinia ruckeri TaxID=29486 RepID=UPI0005381E44|nr:tail fiber assembly protein [Yersinia ruckeri]AUQ42587.1 phage tail protein [Yersinia ruckeri]MCK8543473.1 tail fiber assembly protein [Yersinia ruckeri]MCK8553543.1 tail fiber assembly protein [Yersinia ruckeri]MCW6519770.1 tail fiber assembly protein [Yersinia ruckeri]MCW6551002.1 tail fiber assembly protein [Yersinia ruckeri]